MFFCIILIYVISYLPTIVITILLSQIQVSILSSYFPWIRFLSGFYVVNHAANPFVYAYFDVEKWDKISWDFAQEKRCSNNKTVPII